METLRKKRIESMEIVLEHDIDEQYQYVPGEMLHGVIVIKCVSTIAINTLSVSLKGEGNCTWEGEPSKKGSGKFKSRETYLDITENLITTTANSHAETLEEGVHEYPFYCELSDYLPSSYIGKYGSVTYLIKAQLRPDRMYGSDAMITSEPFLVLRKYDLSLEPYKLQTYEESASQSGASIPCICAGKVKADIKLNRTAFIPGEDLRLNAQVRNSSTSEITSIQGALIMTSRFHANNEKIMHEQMINRHVDKFSIEQGEGRRWNNIRLTIPPYIPESSLEGCDIIDVNYELFFMVEVDGDPKSKKNLQVRVPLTVGTHGIKDDDDPGDAPELRPLYHRTADMQPALISPTHLDDDMDELDHSLFDTTGASSRHQGSSKAPQGGKGHIYQKKSEPRKPNMVQALYGDLISADELPDNRPDPDIKPSPISAQVSQSEETVTSQEKTSTAQRRSRKKKHAPAVPADATEMTSATGDQNIEPEEDDQTRL